MDFEFNDKAFDALIGKHLDTSQLAELSTLRMSFSRYCRDRSLWMDAPLDRASDFWDMCLRPMKENHPGEGFITPVPFATANKAQTEAAYLGFAVSVPSHFCMPTLDLFNSKGIVRNRVPLFMPTYEKIFGGAAVIFDINEEHVTGRPVALLSDLGFDQAVETLEFVGRQINDGAHVQIETPSFLFSMLVHEAEWASATTCTPLGDPIPSETIGVKSFEFQGDGTHCIFELTTIVPTSRDGSLASGEIYNERHVMKIERGAHGETSARSLSLERVAV